MAADKVLEGRGTILALDLEHWSKTILLSGDTSPVSEKSPFSSGFHGARDYESESRNSSISSLDSSNGAVSTSELLRQVAEVLEGEHGEKIMSAVRKLKQKQVYSFLSPVFFFAFLWLNNQKGFEGKRTL